MMTFDPEYLILAFIVVSLATLAWMAVGGDRVLAAITRRVPKQTTRRAPARVHLIKPDARPAFGPVRSATTTDGAERVIRSTNSATPVETQITRLGSIVTSAVATARHAERLHRTAHEQVDAAHYALQNLLNELSAVMPIATPVAASRATKLVPRRTIAGGFETAMAA